MLRDSVFYENSGGGVTLSGGEPLYQYAFTLELLQSLKRHGIHTAVETCGFASRAHVQSIAEYTDLFLFDYKETDAQKHKAFTGVSNTDIWENLLLLNALNKKIVLRCPIVKGLNDTPAHLEGIAKTANRHKNILRVDIEPYHLLGEGKNAALGNAVRPFAVASAEEKSRYISTIQAKTKKPVRLG